MSDAADIEAQAAAWIARADARGDDQDPELAAWLIADPRHRAAYLRLAHAWERTQRLGRLRPADGTIDPNLLAPPRPPGLWARVRRGGVDAPRDATSVARTRRTKASRARTLRRAAAAAILAIALILSSWNPMHPSSTKSYRTGPGGLSRVVLADGSVVTMNADTEVRVDFTAGRRTVTLLRGEAHFAVTHDIHRPFEVHARDRIVVAVGTAFDVRLNTRQDVEVTVTQGRVALLADRASQALPGGLRLQTLSAGQDALLTSSEVTVQRIDSAQISRRLAWELRELSFQGQTLSAAAAEFERYTNRRIAIDDPAIASLEIGGSFRALDIDSFVAALGRAFGVSARTGRDGTIHLYRARIKGSV